MFQPSFLRGAWAYSLIYMHLENGTVSGHVVPTTKKQENWPRKYMDSDSLPKSRSVDNDLLQAIFSRNSVATNKLNKRRMTGLDWTDWSAGLKSNKTIKIISTPSWWDRSSSSAFISSSPTLFRVVRHRSLLNLPCCFWVCMEGDMILYMKVELNPPTTCSTVTTRFCWGLSERS